MNKIHIATLLWLTLNALTLHAQEVSLSLDGAIQAALSKNKEIQLANLEQAAARERFGQTAGVWMPQIKVSYTAMSTNNPLNAFGFKLQQQAITQNDFNPALLNDPSSTQNFMTKAEWLQPIINLDMISMRQAAREEQQVYSYKTKRSQEYIIMEVQNAYAQLQLAHQARQVLNKSLTTVRAIHAAAVNRFEKGYLQKSDVLMVDVQVKMIENRLAQAESNIRNASDFMSMLMGNTGGVAYAVDSISQVIMNNTSTTIPEGRADFRAVESAIAAQEKMIRSGKMSYLPKLNAFGEYLVNDSEALGFGSNSYVVGAQLSWTIFNGTATSHKISGQRIERDKIATQLAWQKEQAQLELNKTSRQLNDASYAIKQHQLAVSQSAEALRIVQNRYQQGLITTNDVLQAQSQLAQQQLELAQAIFQYNTTAALLQFLTTSSEQK